MAFTMETTKPSKTSSSRPRCPRFQVTISQHLGDWWNFQSEIGGIELYQSKCVWSEKSNDSFFWQVLGESCNILTFLLMSDQRFECGVTVLIIRVASLRKLQYSQEIQNFTRPGIKKTVLWKTNTFFSFFKSMNGHQVFIKVDVTTLTSSPSAAPPLLAQHRRHPGQVCQPVLWAQQVLRPVTGWLLWDLMEKSCRKMNQLSFHIH